LIKKVYTVYARNASFLGRFTAAAAILCTVRGKLVKNL